MKVALVHDYLNQAGGAERVVTSLHELFPSAPIYTTIVDHATLWPGLRGADIRPTFMQHLPGWKRHFKAYLPIYPLAIETLNLRGYDLVISSSSAFAKAARVSDGAKHICYCHTPMRFAWDFGRYMERESFGSPVRYALKPVIAALRRWDVHTAARPDRFLANSSVVAERIRLRYGRTADIVFPPVDLDRYAPSPEPGNDDYYLIVSRLIGYKRIDLAVRAFTQLGRRLMIIGDGPDRAALQTIAGPTIEFRGRLDDAAVAAAYARCRGLVFPGEEDFGIVPLEANASGKPVVAFRAGGALDTVVDGQTGIFFTEQSPAALAAAVQRCDSSAWPPLALRRHAERFDTRVFKQNITAVVDAVMSKSRNQLAS